MSNQSQWRATAESFYREHDPRAIGEIDYIDFNYPVKIVSLSVGTRLWGYKDPRSSPLHRRNTFFTVPGPPVEALGVSEKGDQHFVDRETGARYTNQSVLDKKLNVYEVAVTVRGTLLSVCKEGIDTWSRRANQLSVPVKGGGWQYKIPEAYRYLRVITSVA